MRIVFMGTPDFAVPALNKLIEYSLMDIEKVKIKCGIEYLEKEKQKIVKSVKEYENTIINFPYSIYISSGNNIILNETSITILINFSQKQLETLNSKKDYDKQLTTEILTCNELNKLLENKTEIRVDVDNFNVDKCIENIIIKLKQKLTKTESN